MFNSKLTIVLLYAVSVGALHNNCYVSVASNLFDCKCSVVRGRVLRQFGMQQPIPRCPSQPQNVHGITLKGKQDENWFQLLAPMISQWNNRAEFRVDVYPWQEGLLSFNSDYMVWYRRKMKMFVDPKNANIATLIFISFWIFNFKLFCKASALISMNGGYI